MQVKSLLKKALLVCVLATCTVAATFAQTSKPVKQIGGPGLDSLITKNTTWSCDTIYYLNGKIYVTSAAELTIKPGTVIMGDSLNKGSLIITKGSKIHAVGTPTCPIVFTSAKFANRRARGDWGGLIILGKSTINQPGGVANIEGIAPGPLSEYGGGLTPDVNDNSGEISFVRVEFPGVALSLNNEINGITFGGVGAGTLVDYVQVSYSNDDSFEWFGGTVNAKHLIAFRGLDDDFDTDNGYSGKLQFGIGARDPLVADISGSNGFESDNDAGSTLNTPQTRATFSNFTLSAGADSATNSLYRQGAHIRRNSHMNLYNSILMGYPTGLNIDGTTTQNNVTADTMVEHNIFGVKYAPKNVVTTSPSGTTSIINLLNAGGGADNRFFTGNAQILLSNPYNLANPKFYPAAGSPALAGAKFTETALAGGFFTPTKYVGALDKGASKNWASTWVNWKPTSTNYTTACACATAVVGNSAEEAIAAEPVQSVSVYPNPARGVFNVSLNGFTGAVTVKVTNLSGAVVYNKQSSVTAKSVVSVSLNNAPAGLYFVTVSNGAKSITQKINVIQ